jgi:hypothetical protein
MFETERERELGGGGGSERHHRIVGGVRNNKLCLEGSQALLASPSGRVRFDLTLALEII